MTRDEAIIWARVQRLKFGRFLSEVWPLCIGALVISGVIVAGWKFWNWVFSLVGL